MGVERFCQGLPWRGVVQVHSHISCHAKLDNPQLSYSNLTRLVQSTVDQHLSQSKSVSIFYSSNSKSTFKKSYVSKSKKVMMEKVTQVIELKSNFC